MNYLVLITARIGSKRLKFKNIKYLKGYRLFEHTIKFAVNNFDKKNILISTDSKIILNKAKKYNILCPWLRPKQLALDKAKSIDVIKHSIEWFEEKFKKLDYIILLQPTTPYRNILTLKKCLKLFYNYNDFNIKTISLDKKKNGKKKLLLYGNTYSLNGAIYIFPRKNIFIDNSYQYKNKYILIRDKRENLDIDNIEDYNIANQILK